MSKRNINEFGGGGGVEAHWRSEPGKPSYKMFTNSYIYIDRYTYFTTKS